VWESKIMCQLIIILPQLGCVPQRGCWKSLVCIRQCVTFLFNVVDVELKLCFWLTVLKGIDGILTLGQWKLR
jgi:hypothetical protein